MAGMKGQSTNGSGRKRGEVGILFASLRGGIWLRAGPASLPVYLFGLEWVQDSKDRKSSEFYFHTTFIHLVGLLLLLSGCVSLSQTLYQPLIQGVAGTCAFVFLFLHLRLLVCFLAIR